MSEHGVTFNRYIRLGMLTLDEIEPDGFGVERVSVWIDRGTGEVFLETGDGLSKYAQEELVWSKEAMCLMTTGRICPR